MATDSDIQDLREAAGETIYLVPMSIDGGLRYAWCDDPAPEEGMDASEAVEYVRREKYDALAAHVERIRKFWMLIDRDVCTHAERVKLDEIIESAPETSLARRDARMKAEALREADKRLPIGYAAARHVLLDLADEYRRQDEGED